MAQGRLTRTNSSRIPQLATLWFKAAQRAEQSRHGRPSQEFSREGGEAETESPHQGDLRRDLPPGAAFIPAGWPGNDGGRHAARPRAGESAEFSKVASSFLFGKCKMGWSQTLGSP